MRPIDADSLKVVPNVRKVTEYDETGCGLDYLAIPVDVIEAAPTLDVEPVVHGQWLYPAGSKAVSSATCSVCRRRIKFGEYRFYCPACGTKMDGDNK